MQDRAGCGALVKRVQSMFVEFLRKDWGPKTVRMLTEAREVAELENAVMGMPAFPSTVIPDRMAEARRLASEDATKRLEKSLTELMQTCTKEVLRPLKTKLLEVATPLKDLPLAAVCAKWQEQQAQAEAEWRKAVDLWGEHWLEGVRTALEKRTPEPKGSGGNRSERIANPMFEVGRFPALVEAILAELKTLLDGAKKEIAEGAQACTDKYYGKLSPWVELKSNLDGSPATCSVSGRADRLAENIVWTFVEVSTSMMLERLPGRIGKLCDGIGADGWVEEGSEHRLELYERMERLGKATEEILRMLGVESEDELTLQKSGVVPGDARAFCAGVPSYVHGIAVGSNGDVYATDQGTNEVVVLRRSPDGTDEVVMRFGRGHLQGPRGIAIDHKEGTIYVTSFSNNQVVTFGRDGAFRSQFAVPSEPWGIAIHDNRVFVSAHGGNLVQVYSMSGVSERSFGSGFLNYPTGIAVDIDGTVYVASSNGHKAHSFRADGTLYQQYGSGSAGSSPGQLYNPYDVAVDGDFVYVSSRGIHTVQVFHKGNSQSHRVIRNFRARDSDAMLSQPAGLCVDAEGKLLVSSTHYIGVIPTQSVVPA